MNDEKRAGAKNNPESSVANMGLSIPGIPAKDNGHFPIVIAFYQPMCDFNSNVREK